MAIVRGEIYFVDLNPTTAREQSGTRPVLVLSNNTINQLPLVVTVVVGTKGDRLSRDYPTNVRFSPAKTGLPMETVFLCFQIRALDPQRFPMKAAGRVAENDMEKIEHAVRYCLDL